MQLRSTDLAKLAGFEASFPLKSEFRDRYELRSYARALLLGRHLLSDPSLLARGQAYLDRFVLSDPQQQTIYRMWADALTAPVEVLVRHLLADDAQGAALRETAPVFVVISADEINGLVRAGA